MIRYVIYLCASSFVLRKKNLANYWQGGDTWDLSPTLLFFLNFHWMHMMHYCIEKKRYLIYSFLLYFNSITWMFHCKRTTMIILPNKLTLKDSSHQLFVLTDKTINFSSVLPFFRCMIEYKKVNNSLPSILFNILS